MLILGLDPSLTCGWAYYDPSATKLSSIVCGNLRANKEAQDREHKAASVGRALNKLIKERGKPDFIVIEMPPRVPFVGVNKGRKKPKFKTELDLEIVTGHEPDDGDGGGPAGQGLGAFVSTNQIAAALATVAECYGIPFEMIKDESWRKSAYGFGRRSGWKRENWKKHARAMCSQHQIKATNDDMAEACWIAFAGKALQSVRLWMMQRGKAA